MRFDAETGKFVDLLIPAGIEWPELNGMAGFVFDDQGRLYVSCGTAKDQRGSRILRYTPVRRGRL
jgi:hypothetical protein